LLVDFDEYLSGFGGGLNAESTAKLNADYIMKLLKNGSFEPHDATADHVSLIDIFTEKNRVSIDKYLLGESVRTPVGFRQITTALGHLYDFFNGRKQNDIAIGGLERDFVSFSSTLNGWRQSTTKRKNFTNGIQRNKLDVDYERMVEEKWVAQLVVVLEKLDKLAQQKNASMSSKATYLQAMMSFGKGELCALT
jgi:hypothetical protein